MGLTRHVEIATIGQIQANHQMFHLSLPVVAEQEPQLVHSGIQHLLMSVGRMLPVLDWELKEGFLLNSW
jgi:hypothetical protein